MYARGFGPIVCLFGYTPRACLSVCLCPLYRNALRCPVRRSISFYSVSVSVCIVPFVCTVANKRAVAVDHIVRNHPVCCCAPHSNCSIAFSVSCAVGIDLAAAALSSPKQQLPAKPLFAGGMKSATPPPPATNGIKPSAVASSTEAPAPVPASANDNKTAAAMPAPPAPPPSSSASSSGDWDAALVEGGGGGDAAEWKGAAHHRRMVERALSRVVGGPDLETLRKRARYGFVNHALRRRIWPLLLGVTKEEVDELCRCSGGAGSSAAAVDGADADAKAAKVADAKSSPAAADPAVAGAASSAGASSSSPVAPAPSAPSSASSTTAYALHVVHAHRYFDQIGKDIDRSMFHFDVTRRLSDRSRAAHQRALERLCHAVFCAHPDLHYIQGFHDVASVLLLVAGEPTAFLAVERMSLTHIRDALRPALSVVMQMLSLIFPLIRAVDGELHAFIEQSGVMSFVMLSWVLTWFAHNLEGFDRVARVFDFLIASHPSASIYVSAAVR
jgi:hypothetical protein